jgi:hypothetical protein
MKKIILGIGMIAAFAPLVSFAAYMNTGKTVVLNGAEPINDNAYVAGGNVTVSGAINGDLLVAGGSVFVSGNVAQDIMAAGGNVSLSGVTAQDVRVAGGNLSVGAVLSGELMAGGGQITVTPDSKITKDSVLSGGSVTFNGDEAGNLEVNGGSVYIGGTVEKDLTIHGAKDITVGANAVVRGNLDYTGPSEAVVQSGAQILGTKTFHKSEAGMSLGGLGMLAVFFAFWWIAKSFMVLLTAYLLWYLMRKDMETLLAEATAHFGRELLRGFVLLIAVPAAIIVACLTIIGILVGGIAGLFYAALILLGGPVSVLVFAAYLKKRKTDLRWYTILLAWFLIEVVVLIPFIGWFAYLLLYLVSLGALANVLRQRFAR